MEIEEAKEAKFNLEKKICDLIMEFMDDTGLNIHRVDVDFLDTSTTGLSGKDQVAGVEVEIRL